MNIQKKLREFRYRLFCLKKHPNITPSQEKIDVVIPIIEKDLGILPLCLEGIRRCVSHPIKNIYIVAPDKQAIRKFCIDNSLEFVDEVSLMGFSPKSLNIRVGELNRSGWLFQQLIKLSGKVGTCRRYLCVDADHILIQPHTFFTSDGKTVFYMSYEHHQPYYDNIHKLFPDVALAPFSYVDHKMLFDKERLKQLHEELECIGDGNWIDVIVANYDRAQMSGFSEFELYGNTYPEKEKILLPWRQKLLRHDKLGNYYTLCNKYKSSRWSLTFPDYRR